MTGKRREELLGVRKMFCVYTGSGYPGVRICQPTTVYSPCVQCTPQFTHTPMSRRGRVALHALEESEFSSSPSRLGRLRLHTQLPKQHPPSFCGMGPQGCSWPGAPTRKKTGKAVETKEGMVTSPSSRSAFKKLEELRGEVVCWALG